MASICLVPIISKTVMTARDPKDQGCPDVVGLKYLEEC